MNPTSMPLCGASVLCLGKTTATTMLSRRLSPSAAAPSSLNVAISSSLLFVFSLLFLFSLSPPPLPSHIVFPTLRGFTSPHLSLFFQPFIAEFQRNHTELRLYKLAETIEADVRYTLLKKPKVHLSLLCLLPLYLYPLLPPILPVSSFPSSSLPHLPPLPPHHPRRHLLPPSSSHSFFFSSSHPLRLLLAILSSYSSLPISSPLLVSLPPLTLGRYSRLLSKQYCAAKYSPCRRSSARNPL